MIDRRVTRLVWCFVSLRLLPSVPSALRSSLNPPRRESSGSVRLFLRSLLTSPYSSRRRPSADGVGRIER